MKGWRNLLFVYLVWCLTGCATHDSQVRIQPDQFQTEWKSLIATADLEFAKMYWQGWRNAVDCFEKALAIHPDVRLYQKLFDSLLLIAVRELECQHADLAWLKKLEFTLTKIGGTENKAYFLLLQSIVAARSAENSANRFFRTFDKNLENLDIPENPSNIWKSYLHLKFVGEKARDFDEYKKERDSFCSLHRDSNLALFLNQNSIDSERCEQLLLANPDFHEMRVLHGHHLALQKKYGRTLEEYAAVLAKMPFWLDVALEKAKIHLLFDDDLKALECFEQVLKMNPLHAEAMFGKGISLCNLGRLDQADSMFHAMIEKQSLYHGEANYFLGRNLYLRGRRAESRSFVDAARTFIPTAVEMLLLSGILYLESSELEKAEVDFKQILLQNNQVGDAHFNLGLIALQRKQPDKVMTHICEAVRCFWLEDEKMARRLVSIADCLVSEEMKSQAVAKIRDAEFNLVQETLGKLARVKESLPRGRIRMEIQLLMRDWEAKKRSLESGKG